METESRTLSRPRSRKAGVFAVGILAGVAVVIAFASSAGLNPAKSVDARMKTVLPASIRPHTLTTLNSKFAGRIGAVHVAAGVKVQPGDLLLTVTNPDFELEYERAQVHLASIEQRMTQHGRDRLIESQAQTAAAALKAARERLAGVSLDDAQKAYQSAVANVRNLESLAQQQLATERELEDARKIEQTELRNMRAEQEHVSRLKEEVEAAQARVEESREAQLPSEAANFAAELREAQEELRIAGEHRDAQRILATTRGTVLRTLVNAGDEIPSGVPLLQLAQFEQLDFDVPVGAELARDIKVGETVKLRIPTEPPVRIAAPVSAILLVPAQDQSAYTIRITTQNPSPSALLVGLSGEVEFPHTGAAWPRFQF